MWENEFKSIAEEIECPISSQIFGNPVAPFGIPYEESQIKVWIKKQEKDPKLSEKLSENQLNLLIALGSTK